MNGQELNQRGSWGSKVAFIFAASGSAIGLGSIWRFPLMVGAHGGAIYVLAYILAVILIGFTVMLAEFVMALEGGKPMITSGKDHLKTLGLTLACIESSRTGSRVYMDQFYRKHNLIW